MAVNRKILLSIVIGIAVCATALGLFAMWFDSMLDDGHEKASSIDEELVKFWLGCLRSSSFPPRTNNPEYQICDAYLRVLPYVYESTGTINPDYREALSIVYGRNKTRVDIEICLLSEQRCPNESKVLADRFLREEFDREDDDTPADIFDSK